MVASLAAAACAPIEEPEPAAAARERIGQAQQAVQQQPVRMGKFCRTDQIRCGTECVSISDDPHNCGDCGHGCAPSEICVSGLCQPASPAEQAALASVKLGPCEPGETLCEGNCVKLLSDPASCGHCGHACAPAESCKEGTCVASP